MAHYKKYFVLFVDDEPNALKYFEKAFSQHFQILTAENAAEGWKIVQERSNEIGILMTDQRMPGEPGVKLLERVRNSYPQIIRILVTAYADLDSAIEAVNSGSIYKYISKPWDLNDLQITLMRAFDFFIVQNERDQLVQEKMSVIQWICMASQEKNLGCLAAGMAPFFKNSLQAIQRFIEINPTPKGEVNSEETSWRNMENWTNMEIRNISYMLGKIREACGDPYDPKWETLNLKDVAEKVTSSGCEETKFSFHMDPDLYEIRMHEIQIIQVIELLRDNIQSVSTPLTEISLTAKNVTNAQGSKMIELEFSDNLSAWSEDQYEEFFSLHTKNDSKHISGLNFLISLFIIYNHDGEIEVDKSSAQKLRLRIPVAQKLAQGDRDHAEKMILNKILSNEKNWDYF